MEKKKTLGGTKISILKTNVEMINEEIHMIKNSSSCH